jgi:hypothetical protein
MIAMLDKFTEKMVETALSGYMPRLQEMSRERAEELERIKAKVRSNPDEVEAWLDGEIAKARDVDAMGVLKKIKE